MDFMFHKTKNHVRVRVLAGEGVKSYKTFLHICISQLLFISVKFLEEGGIYSGSTTGSIPEAWQFLP